MTRPSDTRGTPISVQGRRLIQEAIRQAARLTPLPNGWNSYDAKPVSPEAVRHATTFLGDALSAIPRLAAPTVVPTVRGGLQLEWHRQGVDIEVEFSADGPDSWCAEDREAQETIEAPVVGQEDAIRQWLRRASG